MKVPPPLPILGTAVPAVAALLFAAAVELAAAPPAAAVGAGAVRLDGFASSTLPPNDDGSTDLVPIGFPVNFFGTTYEFVYVNNNGNLTFDSALSTYTPFDLNSTSRVIIAPFFADVDTSSAGDPVRYGPGLANFNQAFGATYYNVDCYDSSVTHTFRNFFQVVLIDRSTDFAPGDFDIEFNYDVIEWETGEASGGDANCLGGSAARVGFSNGGGSSFELAGSGVPGAFPDTNLVSGLRHNSMNSVQLGRYIFEVRSGVPPTGSSISGLVFHNPPVPGAIVQACSNGFCFGGQADPNGIYRIFGLDAGQYMLRAFPPAGSNLNPATIGPITLGSAQNLMDVDIELTAPMAPPAGTSIEPSNTGPSGLPSVYWNDPLQLVAPGCPGGTATYTVTGEDGSIIESGGMTEAPAGTYTATVGPFFPNAGNAQVSISIDCPGSDPDEEIDFNIYIDPSGVVEDTHGNPIAGATVTLFRSSTGAAGTFVQVPDGSAVMSPSNRTNPDTTDADGRFGWDVVADFYVVRAEKAGCVSPQDPQQAFVESAVLEIPPPVTDLLLVLDCGEEVHPLTIDRAIAWPRRSKAGRIVAKGSLAPGLLDLAGGLTITITDGLVMSETATIAPGGCRMLLGGRVVCRDDGTTLHLAESRRRPGQLDFRVFLRNRTFVKPQDGPITVTIEQDATQITGSVDDCADQESRLLCRPSPPPPRR